MLKGNSLLFILCILALSSCLASKNSAKKKGELTMVSVSTRKVVDTQKLAMQVAYNSGNMRGGFLDPTAYGTNAISIVATGIKSAIAKEKRKYTADYEFSLSSDKGHKLKNDSTYFYSKDSYTGPFDVRDMQFSGFTVARFFDLKDERKIAFAATFEIDTTNLIEIAHDGIFRLKMKKVLIDYAKAKIPRGKKKLNININVEFFSSYVTKEGNMQNNVSLGSFSTNISNIALQDTASFREYDDTPMDGYSFVVPRSYYRSIRGDAWNQGAYTVVVRVSEVAKERYLHKITNSGSIHFIDATQESINVRTLMGTNQ